MSKQPVVTVSREKDQLILKILASGRYRVEADGSLIDLHWRRGKGPISPRKITGRKCRSGHWLVNLATGVEPRQITALLSRVVALAKHGDPGMPLGAVHKDGNIDNNHPDNLAWMDSFEGMQKASSDGRLNIYHGAEHKNAKLTEQQVAEVKRLLAKGESPTTILKKMGSVVSRAAIRQIQAGGSWGHIK